MTSNVEVRHVTREEVGSLQEFWERYRRIEDSGTWVRTCDQLLHDCFLNPLHQNEAAASLAWYGNRPIGHLSASNCPVYLKGEAFTSAWWQGFYVLQEAGHYKADAAVKLVTSVLRQPHAHAMVGIGGTDLQVLKLYDKLKFRNYGLVPLFFKPVNAQRVLRQLRMLRNRPITAFCSNAAATTWLPAKVAELLFVPRFLHSAEFSVREWEVFPVTVDELWSRVMPSFDLIFDRSSTYLNWRFSGSQYRRLGVYRDRDLVGFVVCKLTQMKDNLHFGNLIVGTVVDFICDPNRKREIRHVLRAGVQHLASLGADLVIANASFEPYCQGLRDCGFFEGPSNYMFLARDIQGPVSISQCHITRGDSDGDARL